MNEQRANDAWPAGLSPSSWAQITAGLLQRAHLLETMAREVYAPLGEARHMALPCALTLGHGAYLPQLQALTPPGGRWLGLMTFDIAPDRHGLWWVLGQCSRAAWPHLQSSAPDAWPQALKRWLARWQTVLPAPDHQAPLWVALCPPSAAPSRTMDMVWGPDGTLHAAQATQLMVMERRLYLQTPAGLRLVQGLINLQGNDVLDPLEQSCAPHLGIAGLFDVWRQGQVILLNAPGLVFLDTPAWLGFLPALSQALLSQPLQMPSITSWWCGEPDVPALALQRGQDHWVVPTYPDDGLRPAFAPQSVDALSDVQRTAWAQRMRQDGAAYTVQSRWKGATAWRVLTLIDPDGAGTALSLGPTAAGPHLTPGM